MLVIQGWPLRADAWQTQVPLLRDAGYRVIRYDRRGRGRGRSDKPADGYDHDTLADDLAGLINQRDRQQVTLVGFSMGGGEFVRSIAGHGQGRLHSVVFAVAVPTCLLQGPEMRRGR